MHHSSVMRLEPTLAFGRVATATATNAMTTLSRLTVTSMTVSIMNSSVASQTGLPRSHRDEKNLR